MNLLIKSGNYSVPLEYAINCFKEKRFVLEFKYFSIIANFNHPIAKYYIGLMKYKSLGCIQNRQYSFEIMKWISNNGIDKATEFIENHFTKWKQMHNSNSKQSVNFFFRSKIKSIQIIYAYITII